MNSERAFARAAKLQDGKLLETGGHGSSFLNSAEMLTVEGWENNIPSLPVTIWSHCMVTVNSTTVMAIGGNQNDEVSGKSFYFTFGQQSWTEGPELKYKRSDYDCGRIRKDKHSHEMSILVAGGYDGYKSYLSSAEILDAGSNEWHTGPELPFAIGYYQMVEDQNGGVVLIGGRSSSVSSLGTLYHLPHGGQDAVWTKMEQKLKAERSEHIAFLVPDHIVDCS
jgi:hypothetical protein